MQLNSSTPSISPPPSPSPSSSSSSHIPRQPPPFSTSQPSSSTSNNNILETQSNSSYPSSSHSSPPLFLSLAIPLPTFRGLPTECPVLHLTLFSRLFPSPDIISRNFPLSLLDNAALWHELTIQPHSFSWDQTKSAFLRAFLPPNNARAELISLRQGDVESVNSYHLRMQWILKRWAGHGLPENLVRGLFVDGLRDEFRDLGNKEGRLEEAVGAAMEREAGKGRRCGFCEGRHGESACEARREMREEWMRRRKVKEEEINVNVSSSNGRKSSQCQCWKHQCWKKYGRSASAVTLRNAREEHVAAASAAAGEAEG